jgi:archaetidylinositol phosphate synthase
MRKSRRKALQPFIHERVIDTLTGPAERRVLRWFASRLPGWVKPDMLTGAGFAGALVISVSYIISNQMPGFLWLAVAGFGLNWFGDSLDGTLARVRGIERPRYGYFLDHSVDALNEMLIFFGLGISSYVRFEIAAIALVGYLMLTLYTSLSTYVAGQFKLSYAYVGPTEVRLIAIAASVWTYFDGSRLVQLPFGNFTVSELVVMGLIVMFFSAFIVSTAGQALRLSREDRPPVKKPVFVPPIKSGQPKPTFAARAPQGPLK